MAAKRDNSRSTRALTRLNEWKPVFLETLAKVGNVTLALKAAKVDSHTAYAHRRKDAEFAQSWRRALYSAADLMEAEAWRRAVKGTSKPVYQGGKNVGSIQEYSDTLLIFLLKGVRPKKFRENARVEHTGAKGGAIKTETLIDLSKLTTDELRDYRRIMQRAGAEPARN